LPLLRDAPWNHVMVQNMARKLGAVRAMSIQSIAPGGPTPQEKVGHGTRTKVTRKHASGRDPVRRTTWCLVFRTSRAARRYRRGFSPRRGSWIVSDRYHAPGRLKGRLREQWDQLQIFEEGSWPSVREQQRHVLCP
jgi:hypothetical protein